MTMDIAQGSATAVTLEYLTLGVGILRIASPCGSTYRFVPFHTSSREMDTANAEAFAAADANDVGQLLQGLGLMKTEFASVEAGEKYVRAWLAMNQLSLLATIDVPHSLPAYAQVEEHYERIRSAMRADDAMALLGTCPEFARSDLAKLTEMEFSEAVAHFKRE